MKTLCVSIAFLFGLFAMPAAIVAGVTFTGLGYLPGGGIESWARGASYDGSVVVGWSKNSDGFYEPFRWTAAGGLVGLGQLPGGTNGNAYGVSADGSVIVGASAGKAFRWTLFGGMVSLDVLPNSPGARYHANAVSADGQFAAGNVESRPGIFSEAAAWLPGLVTLGDLPDGSFYSEAKGISGDGSVVVGVSDHAGWAEAFRWSGGAMTGLGYLPGGAGASDANAISADGETIVGTSYSPLGPQAFRWTSATGMVGLGDLAGGQFLSNAMAVSADGSVIVGNGSSAFGEDAFVWDALHGMRGLRDTLTTAGVDLTGWSGLNASGVSGDGRTIVGIGRRDGANQLVREAWIATIDEPAGVVPEPGTLAIWGIGMAGIVARGRRWPSSSGLTAKKGKHPRKSWAIARRTGQRRDRFLTELSRVELQVLPVEAVCTKVQVFHRDHASSDLGFQR